jgi:ligand-binding SRPBCC domain-containing protein
MTQRFTTSQWVPFPLELVFAFFADPANLPRLMPANLKTKIEEARIAPAPPIPASSNLLPGARRIAAGKGSEIVISFRPVPIIPSRVRWTARIVEFQWNHHFCDEQVRGPFASFRHCHRTKSETRNGITGTLVTDEIAFQLPFGFLGRIAGVFVRRNLAGSFAHRQEQLLALLQAASHPAL